ncbi:hypothetical protein GUJ93_ZPchr0012g20262 [Zizania palustris]|uniref:Uncharacterized protein n=1 Tax=Zizania palustris TaxID=103762 RepID=A0A8J6BVG6_ZIZPA|nr:hypothetical protein GUJ93_ZPchr0012g20262 [Zizania palustris]
MLSVEKLEAQASRCDQQQQQATEPANWRDDDGPVAERSRRVLNWCRAGRALALKIEQYNPAHESDYQKLEYMKKNCVQLAATANSACIAGDAFELSSTSPAAIRGRLVS